MCPGGDRAAHSRRHRCGHDCSMAPSRCRMPVSTVSRAATIARSSAKSAVRVDRVATFLHTWVMDIPTVGPALSGTVVSTTPPMIRLGWPRTWPASRASRGCTPSQTCAATSTGASRETWTRTDREVYGREGIRACLPGRTAGGYPRDCAPDRSRPHPWSRSSLTTGGALSQKPGATAYTMFISQADWGNHLQLG